MKATFKDPVSASTHFAGFLAAVVGLIALVRATPEGDTPKLWVMAIYGAGLVSLFLASSCYHFFDLGPRANRLLRRFDHAAIFLFIAASYGPTLLHTLDGAWRLTMISVVAVAGTAGAVMKLAFGGGPRWLSVGLYLVMGWAITLPIGQMWPHLSATALTWMLAGGLAYTVGAIIYGIKRPDPWPNVFGFHEIWHIFVLAGAGAHYALAWTYLDQPYTPF